MNTDSILFSGTANPHLAGSVARCLEVPLGACRIGKFPDGEVSVHLDQPVRGYEVFLVQPTSPPVSEHLVEMLAFADACRRASARRITAIVPYFGYARADKRNGDRGPVTGSMVARLMEAVGIDHVVTIDLHSAPIEGFFHIPVDKLTAVPTLCDALRPHLPKEIVVVSPDEGRVKMATEYAHHFRSPVVVLHKQRQTASTTKITQVIGDVRDRHCLIIDDMISTGNTIAESVNALLKAGALPEITVAATHGVLVDGAPANLSHQAIREIFVTDTIAIAPKVWPKLRVVSIAPLIAAAIRRFRADESISDLFDRGFPNPLETENYACAIK